MNSNVQMKQETGPRTIQNIHLVYRWSNAIPSAPKHHRSPVTTPHISNQLTAISGRA